MSRHRRASIVATVLAGVALAGCTDAGGLEITNETDARIEVNVDDDVTYVEANGGIIYLDLGCTDGDVTVTLEDGTVLTVRGPVCPPDRIVVRNSGAELVTPDSDD
ncbi:hypothetical protein QQX09_13700 [Demequina sp. SYSU T00192]|uniref:NusG domain-containing protein n=1 Tax=Demequina litoralis TaxID=3051660 RepID=A0ABT8GCP2_9MICO|nr:hypothetical protein [Demequina sp. SYSU T00192]MDN4476908.1 hypothetical protein [Demequina sp. SYSU T00192]